MIRPRITAVMLVNGRHEMAARAIKCFVAQTYPNKRLLIYDTGAERLAGWPKRSDVWYVAPDARTSEELRSIKPAPIGRLRNIANHEALKYTQADILTHWDSDDWSNPHRMVDEFSFLENSYGTLRFTKEGVLAGDLIRCVGYRSMLFWDSMRQEAWSFSTRDERYLLGTSMFYTRQAWLRAPFHDGPYEDHAWWQANNAHCLGFHAWRVNGPSLPLMVASIHDGNTSAAYDPAKMQKAVANWQRVPQMDDYCRKVMAL